MRVLRACARLHLAPAAGAAVNHLPGGHLLTDDVAAVNALQTRIKESKAA